MPIIDANMEIDMGTARDSLMASISALSVAAIHEGSNPWLMVSSVIAALETLLNNGGATVVPKFLTVSLPPVASATVQNTTLTIPAGSIIMPGSFIKVATAETNATTKTIDIGISGGDEDGLIDGLSMATAGSILPTLADGAATVGVLNSVDESSGDLVPEGHVCAAETTICYTLGDESFETLVALLYLLVIEP